MSASSSSTARARAAILLINLGTPSAPTAKAVRPYLKEFLSDPRVIHLPAPLRWFLVNVIILNTRPKKSARAYQKIWTDAGSPLLLATDRLAAALDARVRAADLDQVMVRYAMRYGAPSLADVLDELRASGVDRLVVVPLYPQYAAATTASSLERVNDLLRAQWVFPAVHVVPPFYDDSGFLDAQAALVRAQWGDARPGHTLMSFHGLPEDHVTRADASGQHCLRRTDCCDQVGAHNRLCYRAHCFATARGLAARLGLDDDVYSVTFQSRLGRQRWLTPATSEQVVALARGGVEYLSVVTPAFVADCLETLEEIGVEARKAFLDAGGKRFDLVPCVNDHPLFVEALFQMAQSSGFLEPAQTAIADAPSLARSG